MGFIGDAMTEAFFGTWECEGLDRHRFTTRSQAKAAIFDFIEGGYGLGTPPTSAPPNTGGARPATAPPIATSDLSTKPEVTPEIPRRFLRVREVGGMGGV
ncbi:hypothetical protein C3Y87_21030 [Carbonactinospora thermoautotrophica]|nr:hypothetical protein [Carbonactinospora thermoautotrophica]